MGQGEKCGGGRKYGCQGDNYGSNRDIRVVGAVQRVLTLLLVGWDREWDMLKVESLRDRKAVHQRLLVENSGFVGNIVAVQQPVLAVGILSNAGRRS